MRSRGDASITRSTIGLLTLLAVLGVIGAADVAAIHELAWIVVITNGVLAGPAASAPYLRPARTRDGRLRPLRGHELTRR
jgi:hypothetical protein